MPSGAIKSLAEFWSIPGDLGGIVHVTVCSTMHAFTAQHVKSAARIYKSDSNYYCKFNTRRDTQRTVMYCPISRKTKSIAAKNTYSEYELPHTNQCIIIDKSVKM